MKLFNFSKIGVKKAIIEAFVYANDFPPMILALTSNMRPDLGHVWVKCTCKRKSST